MAEKRFYWLKLKENYFDSPKIKKLRKIAGGDTYTIIYLKMQLLSICNGGIINFEGIELSFEEELALKLDEQLEDVQLTLAYLKQQKLVEESDESFLLIEACNNIGSEGQSAERKRRFDARKQERALLGNGSVTEEKRNSISNISNLNSNSSLFNSSDNNKEENKIKEEKHKYGEYKNVLLTNNELEKLKTDFYNYQDLITYLDEYIEMKGYKAKSHYLAIRKWVVDAVERENREKFNKNKQNSKQQGDGVMEILQDLYEKCSEEG